MARSYRLGFSIALEFSLALALVSTLTLAQAASAQDTAAPVVRILEPPAGASLQQNFVRVRWVLENPGISADPTPNFRVQLDGRDPVSTKDKEFTVAGVGAGEHTVVVQLVDANGVPIPGARADARFQAAPPGNPAEATESSDRVVRAALQRSPVQRDANGRELPPASSALPLVSLVGFGVLLGGIASALKTR